MEARVLDVADIRTDEVQILTKVRVRMGNTGKEKTYQLVTESDADSLAGKIAVTTPIAKGLMGKKVGDIVEVQVPAGLLKLEILEISI
jgi:transcription elongation factor GreA